MYLRNGVLYRRLDRPRPTDEPGCQLILPRALRDTLLKTIHVGVAGHLGALKTKVHVGHRAYWFKWRRDVDIFVRKCDPCNEFHRGRIPPKQGKLMPMVLGSPFERWGIDLAGQFLRSSQGYEYVMTAIDAFSKYIVLVPLRDKKAITVARAIYNHVFLKYGAGEILTDNGGEFRNLLLDELCRLLGVARAFTTAYHARTNAVCERSHATVNSMLSKCVADNQKDWSERLASVAFFYNAAQHDSTQHSPYFLMHGTEPRWNIDFQLGTEGREPHSVNDYADLLVNRLEDAHELAREHLKRNAKRMQDWYDKKVHTQSFEPGDEVYVLNLRLYPGRCPKWVRQYSYKGVIVKRINNVTYTVRCDKWRERERIIHVDKLKIRRHLSEIEQDALDREAQPPSC